MEVFGSISIMISISLSGPLSPRASEPNKAACITPRPRRAFSDRRNTSMASELFIETV